MNNLILEVGRIKGEIYGIIKTPCFPCAYYGGRIIYLEFEKQWIPGDNSCGFYESEDKALDNAQHMLETMERYYKNFADK